MKSTCFIAIFLSAVSLSGLRAQSVHTPLRKGDRHYDREEYKEAEKQYRIAVDRDMGNPKAVFNLGNTLYLEGKFEDAAQRFEQVANTEQNPSLRADALHNLGDAALKMRKYKAAVQAYEQSLRLRPADPGTKQNLQMAKKRLKEEEQKEKEKNQQNQQQQNQQQQNQDPNQQQQQQPPQTPNNQQNAPQPPTDPSEQPQNAPQNNETQQLKKEDAKRLLENAIEKDDRKNARKYRAVQAKPDQKKPKKDW